MDKLLAKSPRKNSDGTVSEVSLKEHTRDVVVSANAIFGDKSITRLGNQWLTFFKIPDHGAVFRKNLLAACVLHDWGKANDTFQNAVLRKGVQAIRHEHLSALLIALPPIQNSLVSHGFDFPLVLSAVLTHHLKAKDTRDGFAGSIGGPVFRIVNYSNGFQDTINYSFETLAVPTLHVSQIPTRWEFGNSSCDVRQHRDSVNEQFLRPFKKAIQADDARRKLLMAVRAALIVADAVGSGIVRENQSISDWVNANVSLRSLLTREEVDQHVIGKRVTQMRAAGKWQDKDDGRQGFSDFQIACDTLPDRAILLAPCGSGKTIAAWRWIAARLKDKPVGHALFLYPTRATAREGFKDYVSWAPEADAALMHGTSGFDLEGMFENPKEPDEREGRDYTTDRRLYSLGYWSKRAFSATVDQFMAFMQFGYGPMCMLPVLADSVVVIDEVHSFDRNMFSSLKDFLKNFDVPVLCMTATLPKERVNDLVNECGLSPPTEWPADLLEVARIARYQVRTASNRIEAEAIVRIALSEGKRVLWVVNQVKRAHAIVQRFVPDFDASDSGTKLLTHDGIPVVCYHSRYKLEDRVARHKDTMKHLKLEWPTAALGVTTQVCEMSLDIDVDLLVTEECPVTSLIQRMGRCNRQTNARSLVNSGRVVIYPSDNGDSKPYDENDLTGLRQFIDSVNGKNLNHEELDIAMRNSPCPESPGDVFSRFLTSGPYASAPKDDDGEGYREGNDYNRQCVLLRDVLAFKQSTCERKPGYVLPVPRGKVLPREDFEEAYSNLPGYLGVAPNENYHPAVGFCDFSLRDWRTI